MMSLQDLLLQEGVLWSLQPPEDCSPFDHLLWTTSSELASMIETYLTVEQFDGVAPEAIKSLQGAEAYFENRGVLRPQSVLLVLLRLRRHQAGLEEH